RADHAEGCPALRGAETGQGGRRSRRTGPNRVVELKPECDVQREAGGRPNAQAKKQRWTRRTRDIREPPSGALRGTHHRSSSGFLATARCRACGTGILKRPDRNLGEMTKRCF